MDLDEVRMFLALRLGLAGLSCCAVADAYGDAPQLGFPVACQLGETCFIQNHVDHDDSAGARDFACGTLTYDGHNGTDIRIPTLRAQRAGVDVLVAASGRVLRVRDGVPDISVPAGGAVKGVECGNGLIIDHGHGWETQYCHLAQGSIRVAAGDEVRAGEPIGQIGMSGLTEYPHLHFTVRQRGRVVDPFAFEAVADTCGSGTSIWGKAVQSSFSSQPGAVLNAGFAAGPVTMEAIEAGEPSLATPGPESPALVAYVRSIGLRAGDVQTISLSGPDGRLLAEHRGDALDRPKAQFMLYAGLRRPTAGWAPGRYQAKYKLIREGSTVLEREI